MQFTLPPSVSFIKLQFSFSSLPPSSFTIVSFLLLVLCAALPEGMLETLESVCLSATRVRLMLRQSAYFLCCMYHCKDRDIRNKKSCMSRMINCLRFRATQCKDFADHSSPPVRIPLMCTAYLTAAAYIQMYREYLYQTTFFSFFLLRGKM